MENSGLDNYINEIIDLDIVPEEIDAIIPLEFDIISDLVYSLIDEIKEVNNNL